MQRRSLFAAPVLLAAPALIRQASAQAAPRIVTEEFMIPTGDAGIEVFLRSKRPEGAAAAPGRTLLMLHGGLFGASTSFDLPFAGVSWVDYIAARGFDVWTLDMRGFGRASRPAALSAPADRNPPAVRGAEAMRDLAAAVAHIRRTRGIERLGLLGHGWNSVQAGRYAAEQPAEVERLVLFGTPWVREGATRPAAALPAWRALTQAQLREQVLTEAPEDRRAALLPPGWFEHFAGLTWALDPDGVRQNPQVLRVPYGSAADQVETWNAGQPGWDPAGVRAPALVVVGEWDRTTPPAMGLAAFERLTRSPGKRFVVVGDGTHQMWMERNRGALFQAVQVFLEEAAG
jgi:pimeloyl-ACP methyl ester carboxylesterase